jgi:S1-C subfamily serine protease
MSRSSLACCITLLSVALLAPAVLAQSADSPETTRAWLGVKVQHLDDALREAFDLDGPGVLVNSVVEDSPADEAGLRTGDIITRVDGRPVGSTSELRRLVQRSGVGPVEIEYVRRGRVRGTEAELRVRGERRAPRVEKRRERVIELMSGVHLGVRLQTLDADLASYFDVEPGDGVLVLEVVEDSPAMEAGLRGGDVITAIDDEPVASAKALQRLIRAREPGDEVTVSFVRRGRHRELDATLAAQHTAWSAKLHDLPEIRLPELDREDWETLGRQFHQHYDQLRQRLDEEPIELDERLRELETMVEQLREELAELKADRRR